MTCEDAPQITIYNCRINDPLVASWSPNGKYIVWTDGIAPNIVDAATGDTIAYVGGNPQVNSYFADKVDDVAWSPDGRFIATASSGAIQIWKAPS